jgi:hypothetical protein
MRSEDSRLDTLTDTGDVAGLDDKDPKSLARFMRKMASEAGEELGPEFDEVVGRLEAGEDPDSIEETMPDLGGAGDDFGVM